MIEINTSELLNQINNIESILNEYELVQLNLFNQLKNCFINWQDGNSVIFEEEISLEKQESLELFDVLSSQKDIYKYIYDKYNSLGKKIKCNLNEKEKIINLIDECYNKVLNVYAQFNNIDRSFYYDELYRINIQRDNINNIKSTLSSVKSEIVKLFNNIEEIEVEINNKIKSISQLDIRNVNFNIVQ